MGQWLWWVRFPNIGAKLASFVSSHWPSVCNWLLRLRKFVLALVWNWGDSCVRGFCSFLSMETASVFFAMWCGCLCLTSVPCLGYVLLLLGTAQAATCKLDRIYGLLVLALLAILALWIYGFFLVTVVLFLTGVYMFSIRSGRLLIFFTTTYFICHIRAHGGWLGICLSSNAAFISNDLLYTFVQEYINVKEEEQFEDLKETDSIKEDYPKHFDSCSLVDEAEHLDAQKTSSETHASSETHTILCIDQKKNTSSVEGEKTNSSALDEMKRIISSANHYEVVGFSRSKYVDRSTLRKEYMKKAMLVHPDKNMGNAIAVESFKKLQCAYEVLSDIAKKKDYDEQLRRQESKSICQKSSATYHQNSVDCRPKESRRIECTKCRKSHLWICTNRSKIRARWCQDCHLHHPAKDGDGWIESERSIAFSTTHKMSIQRAFVCVEFKIFEVSEWASCQIQGTPCRPNTHCPSFHVNKVGVNRSIPRLDLCKYQWVLHVDMITREEEVKIWLDHAIATGLLTSKQKKLWSPLKVLNQTKGKLLRRMSLP